MSQAVKDLELSVRSTNALRSVGIETVDQLRAADLRKIPGIGARCRREIEEVLRAPLREMDPDLWAWVLANHRTVQAIREGRLMVLANVRFKES